VKLLNDLYENDSFDIENENYGENINFLMEYIKKDI
jgi:hypothetical protein